MLPVKQEIEPYTVTSNSDFHSILRMTSNSETRLSPEPLSAGIAKNGCGSSFVYCVGGGNEQAGSHQSLKSERGFPIFHCDQCEYETFSLATLSSHRKTHAVKKLFQCDVCHMKFSQAANMRRHRMRHTGVKPYECRVCCKRFFRKDHLMEHTVTHAKQPPFRCPLCGKDFHRQAHLRDHLSIEHTNDDIRGPPGLSDRVCRVCGHRAATAKGAKLHYTSRHNRKSLPSGLAITEGSAENADERSGTSAASPPPQNGVFCYLGPSSYPNLPYPPGILSIADAMRVTVSPPPPQVSQVSSAYANNRNGTSDDSRAVVVKKEMDSQEESAQNDSEKRSSSPSGREGPFPPTPDSSRPQVVGTEGNAEGGAMIAGGLQCCHCGIIFPDQTLYFLHKGLHSEGNPWKCNICGESYGDKYEFNAHVLSKAHQ